MLRRMIAVLVLVGLLVGAVGGVASAREVSVQDDGVAAQLGWGLAAVGLNLGYIPAKLLYAAGGGVVGGLAWIFTAGSNDAANSVWYPSVGGTWVLTPDMVAGNNPVYFNGPSFER